MDWMNDIFLHDIWVWLRDTFGWEMATALLYIGFALTLMAAICQLMRYIRIYYLEGEE